MSQVIQVIQMIQVAQIAAASKLYSCEPQTHKGSAPGVSDVQVRPEEGKDAAQTVFINTDSPVFTYLLSEDEALQLLV